MKRALALLQQCQPHLTPYPQLRRWRVEVLALPLQDTTWRPRLLAWTSDEWAYHEGHRRAMLKRIRALTPPAKGTEQRRLFDLIFGFWELMPPPDPRLPTPQELFLKDVQ